MRDDKLYFHIHNSNHEGFVIQINLERPKRIIFQSS